MSDQQPETPPVSSQETPGAAASVNGAHPVDELDGVGLAAEIAREVRLMLSAVEEVNMRLQAVQVGLLVIAGLALLAIALELKELRK